MPNENLSVESLLQEIAKLKSVITGLESSSKMLIRRDLDLRKAHTSLKSLDKEKSEFVAIAAHQLRTPLTTTLWAHRMIIEDGIDNLNEKQQKLLQRSAVSVDHIHELVEELIKLDKLEYGNNSLKLQSGSVQKLIESLVNSHQPVIESRGLLVEKKYLYDEAINFDALQLSEALGNLIDNAIKYTPDNGKIFITVKKVDDFVSIEIADTGIGVPAGNEERLFQKFSRMSNAESVDAGGSGLGLYITRKIIENHKGSISYAHNQDCGSIFTVKVPC
jgi:two-component system, OmpR family, phosphate regulon sensor histidine kinase PhoR